MQPGDHGGGVAEVPDVVEHQLGCGEARSRLGSSLNRTCAASVDSSGEPSGGRIVGEVDRDAVDRVIALFESRGQLDRLEHVDDGTVRVCLDRAADRLRAASVLADAGLWESAFTAAYDAYRTAADAIVLRHGYRVPATPGGHRIATDVAHAALQSRSAAFTPATAERFRQGRHESEYFDPARPVEKTAGDVRWAIDLATAAIGAVDAELSAG